MIPAVYRFRDASVSNAEALFGITVQLESSTTSMTFCSTVCSSSSGKTETVVNDQDGPVVQYVWGRFWVNNHAHVLTGSNGISAEYLRELLDHVNIRPFVTGAVQPKLNQRNLKSVPILVPPPEMAAAFDDIIAPFFAWLRQADDQSRELESIRDLLLPQLLSGQARVEVADG